MLVFGSTSYKLPYRFDKSVDVEISFEIKDVLRGWSRIGGGQGGQIIHPGKCTPPV